MNRLLSWGVVVVLIFSGCKSQQVSKRKAATIESRDYDYFSARTKLSFSDSATSLHATAIIKMKHRDSIWVSLSKGTLPVARALLTRDSVYFLNKFKKNYSIYSYQEFSEMVQVNLGFDQVENLLLGNLITPQLNKDKVEKRANRTLISQKRNGYNLTTFVDNNSRKVNKLQVIKDGSIDSLSVNYANFEEVDNHLFAKEQQIEVTLHDGAHENQLYLILEYAKVKFGTERQNMPFKIPRSYKRN